MKIKQIKINGIRGFIYKKDSPHIIDLNYKHLFLYGKNGTGKSSFFDAFEWVLTGSIEEAHIRRIEREDILRNKFCKDKDVPFVEIVYKNENNDEKSFVRDINKKNKFGIEDIVSDNFIDTKRIENFVVDTKKSLWNRFADLLGFEDLILFEKRLVRLKNEAEKRYKDVEENFEIKQESLKSMESDKKDLENRFRKNLGENWENSLKSWKKTVEPDTLRNLKCEISDYLQAVEHKQVLSNKLRENKEEFKKVKSTLSEAAISKIIDETYNYFKGTQGIEECPVCGQPIAYENVLERLENLHNKLNRSIDIDNRIKNLKNNIFDESKNIEKHFSKIKVLYKKLYNIELKEESKDLYEVLRGKKEEIERKIEQQKAIMKSLEEFGRYNNLSKEINEVQKQLESLKKNKNLRKKILEDIGIFYEKYKQKYSERISKELEEISKKKIIEIYNKINKANNEIVESFTIKPNVKREEITFQAKIQGKKEMVNAISLLSTAHLKCLGFALLIARLLVRNNEIKFIVIDDPIYSVDHEHRYFLLKYLKELGNDYQLIITTSDRVFYDLIRHQFNSQSFIAYKTYFGNFSTTDRSESVLGVDVKSDSKNYIEIAEKHLEESDIRAASLYSRLALETILFNVAEKVNINIPYKRIKKIGIKDLIDNKLKEKLKEKYREHENDIDDEFQKLSDHRYFKSLLRGFPLDEEVHFPHEERSSYTIEEINEVITTLKDFNDFIIELME